MSVQLIEKREIPSESVVRLTLEVTGGTKSDIVKEALRAFATEQNIPGIQGMSVQALRAAVEEKIGADALSKRASAFLAARTAMPIIKEQGYTMMFAPEPVNGVIPALYDKSYVQYDVNVMLKPSFKLSSYAPVNINESPALVTEDMIDAQLKREVARFATVEPKHDPIEEDDLIVASMRTLADGQPEPGLSGERLRIILSRDSMPGGFVENVVGLSAGDHKDFSFSAIDQGNQSAVPVLFEVSIDILEVSRRVLPELTDEFVSTHLSQSDKTVAEFRKRVRIYLAKQLQEQALVRREELVDAELGSRLQGVIPDALIERTRDDMIDSIRQNATAQGLTLLQFVQQQGMDERQFQMNVAMQARASLRQGLALDALYHHLQLPLTDADYSRALTELAPGNEELARENFLRNDAWYLVEQMAGRLKAHEWAVTTAAF